MPNLAKIGQGGVSISNSHLIISLFSFKYSSIRKNFSFLSSFSSHRRRSHPKPVQGALRVGNSQPRFHHEAPHVLHHLRFSFPSLYTPRSKLCRTWKLSIIAFACLRTPSRLRKIKKDASQEAGCRGEDPAGPARQQLEEWYCMPSPQLLCRFSISPWLTPHRSALPTSANPPSSKPSPSAALVTQLYEAPFAASSP